MNFGQGQLTANDTTCCLFNCSSKNTNQKSNRLSQDGLKGIQSNFNNYKLKFNAQKMNNNIQTKNNKSETPRQKQKVNLSKISARKTNNSSGHFQHKEVDNHQGNSTASAPKSKAIEVNNNYLNLANLSFLQAKHKVEQVNPNSLKGHISFPHQELVRQTKGYQASPFITKVVPHMIQTPKVASNQPIYIRKSLNQSQKLPMNNYVFPAQTVHQPVLKTNMRTFSRFTTKPQSSAPQSTLMNSVNINSRVNSGLRQPIKGGQTNAPTLPSDRIMELSQSKQVQYKPIQRLITSVHNNVTINGRQDTQIHQSRLTDNLSPNFARNNLKTVQSIYGSEMGNKRQVQQSVILVDYFNPSQHLRQQIQAKIKARSNSQFTL